MCYYKNFSIKLVNLMLKCIFQEGCRSLQSFDGSALGSFTVNNGNKLREVRCQRTSWRTGLLPSSIYAMLKNIATRLRPPSGERIIMLNLISLHLCGKTNTHLLWFFFNLINIFYRFNGPVCKTYSNWRKHIANKD